MDCVACKQIKHNNFVRFLIYMINYRINKQLPVTSLLAAHTIYPKLEYINDGRPIDPNFFAIDSCSNC